MYFRDLIFNVIACACQKTYEFRVIKSMINLTIIQKNVLIY